MGDWKSPASLKAFYENMVEEQRKAGPCCDHWFEYREEHVLEMKLRIANCLLERPPHVEQGIQRLTDFLDSFTPEQRMIVDKVFSVLVGLFNGSVKTIELSRILVGLKTAEGEHKILIMKLRTREEKDTKTYFVDHLARRYAHWNDFMRKNRLPPGYFVFPRNGQYLLEGGKYLIDQQWLKRGREKAAKIMDYFMLILGVGVGVVVIVGIFIPLTTPLVLTAISLASFAPLFWGGGRCAWALHDRHSHGQSVADLESVPLWVGIAAATLGVAAGGAAAVGLTSGVLGVADDVAGVLVNSLRLAPLAGASVANLCAVTSVGGGRLPLNEELVAIMWSLFVMYNIALTAKEVHELCTSAAHYEGEPEMGGVPISVYRQVEFFLRRLFNDTAAALPLIAGEHLRRHFGPINKAETKEFVLESIADLGAQLANLCESFKRKDANNNGSDAQLSISFEHRMALEPSPTEEPSDSAK